MVMIRPWTLLLDAKMGTNTKEVSPTYLYRDLSSTRQAIAKSLFTCLPLRISIRSGYSSRNADDKDGMEQLVD